MWSPRQARLTLFLFLLIFTAGQVKACLTRPIYPNMGQIREIWPPEGCLIDATALKSRALEVFPRGTIISAAVSEMGLSPDPLGSGFCTPRAGVLYRVRSGWRVRAMTQKERWIWRIPMDLYQCEPADLKRISGIGPSLAERIYRFVQNRGSLESISQMDEVSGVGKGKLKALEKELELY